MKLAAPCSFSHRDTHIPALTHDKNKMPAKERQNQSSVKYRTQGSDMLLYRALSSGLRPYLLMGRCHLPPCLLPDGTVWSDRLRGNTAFEIRVCLSLPQKTSGRMENSPAEFGSCEANIKIFLSVGFLICLSYLRTGWDISLIITRLSVSMSEKC